MKNGKNPDISDNSLCTGHASGRIGNSAWHSLCYRGRSQDQFFQAYHDQGAEQNTEDHRSQKGQKISWKSSNSKIVAVNKAGKLQAKAKGSATITGTVSKRKYTCKVTVQAPKLNKTAVTLKVGQTYQLKLSGTNQKITWKSSNSKIVTVNKAGRLSARSAGNATITAQVNGIRFVCKVKIQKKAAPAKPAPTAAPAKPAPTAAPAKPTPTAAPKPGIKLKNHILSKGKKTSDGSVKIELNTHDESKKSIWI